jgi:TPR repeat protein
MMAVVAVAQKNEGPPILHLHPKSQTSKSAPPKVKREPNGKDDAASLCLKGWALDEKEEYSQAARLYQRACDAGSADACNNLGVDYAEGTGVQRDEFRAASLYEKACDGGNANGCSDLGDLYWRGFGVAQDRDKGRELLQKGCNMGNQWGCDKLKILQ